MRTQHLGSCKETIERNSDIPIEKISLGMDLDLWLLVVKFMLNEIRLRSEIIYIHVHVHCMCVWPEVYTNNHLI